MKKTLITVISTVLNLVLYSQVAVTLSESNTTIDPETGYITECSYDFSANSQGTILTIPNEINEITVNGVTDGNNYNGVFSNKNIIELNLPSTIVHIGMYVFCRNNIQNIEFLNCTVLTTIGDYAFWRNRIQSIDFSDCENLETIGKNAFSPNANSLINLDFSGCPNLTIIGNDAFFGRNIQNLNFSNCTGLTTIRKDAFRNNDITNLDLSSCINLTTIEEGAFSKNSLSVLSLPNSLINIGAAFNSNAIVEINGEPSNGIIYGRNDDGSEDKSIIVSYGGVAENIDFITEDVIEIKKYAFAENNLECLDLSYCINLATIGEGAFFGTITSLNLSNCTSLTTIENRAFFHCGIDSLDFSDCINLETIGKYAFHESNSIKYINFSNCSGLTTIGEYAFYGGHITSLDFSACINLKTIGSHAFSGSSLSNVTFGESSFIRSIGGYAFESWNNSLDYILLPENENIDFNYYLDSEGFQYEPGDIITDFSRSYFIDALISISDQKNDYKLINIYPNPTYNVLFIECKEPNGFYVLYNISGVSIQRGKLNNVTKSLDLSSFDRGTYLLEICHPKTSVIKKIIKL